MYLWLYIHLEWLKVDKSPNIKWFTNSKFSSHSICPFFSQIAKDEFNYTMESRKMILSTTFWYDNFFLVVITLIHNNGGLAMWLLSIFLLTKATHNRKWIQAEKQALQIVWHRFFLRFFIIISLLCSISTEYSCISEASNKRGCGVRNMQWVIQTLQFLSNSTLKRLQASMKLHFLIPQNSAIPTCATCPSENM